MKITMSKPLMGDYMAQAFTEVISKMKVQSKIPCPCHGGGKLRNIRTARFSNIFAEKSADIFAEKCSDICVEK